jgi:hypothetical protein
LRDPVHRARRSARRPRTSEPGEPSQRARRGRRVRGRRGDLAHLWARIDRSFGDPPGVSGLFDSPVVSTYEWTEHYDRDRYLAMLATQSSYVLSESAPREQLLGALGELIDRRLGGVVTKRYLTVLAVAAKASSSSGGGPV